MTGAPVAFMVTPPFNVIVFPAEFVLKTSAAPSMVALLVGKLPVTPLVPG